MQELLIKLQSMTIGEIIGGSAFFIFIFSLCVEITPIKWNPLTSILEWIGKRMNGKLLDRVEEKGQKIDKLDEKIDMNEIDHIRWEILNFANTCRYGMQHTQDEFEHIINLHEKYVQILEERSLKNGLITIEYEYITELYKKNDFLEK